MKQYYFISGLPRSGTTLLSTIFNQNPRFHTSIFGPLEGFSSAIIENSSNKIGYMNQNLTTKKIITGIFNNYYDYPNKEIFFDVNYKWNLNLPLIKDLFPYTKIILCVRDIEWILDSFEQLVRKSPYTITNLFSKEENINVYTRSKSLLIEDGILGYSYTTLKHAITSIEKNMIYILEYEKLCRFPEQTMKEIYTFIDQDHYDHDFDNLENSYNQFYEKDSNLSEVFNIRKKLEYIPRQMIIPPDILEEVRGLDIWR